MTKIRVHAASEDPKATKGLAPSQDTPQGHQKATMNKTDEVVVTLLEDAKDLDPRLLAVSLKYQKMDAILGLISSKKYDKDEDVCDIAQLGVDFDPLSP
jgi:hypothetical protein